MELKQLEHFAGVAKCNHMSKAADSLYITQSALSKSIAKLEEEIGLELFDRGKGRIALNQTGTEFLEYAEAVLNAYGKLTDFCEQTKEEGNPLRVIAPDERALKHVVSSISLQYPELELQHDMAGEDQLCDMIAEHQAAAAITLRMTNDPRLTVLPLYSEHASMIVPAGHRLYDREVLHIADLNGETIICSQCDTDEALQMVRGYARYGARVKTKFVEDWMFYTNAVQNSKDLIASSDIAEKYLPPNPSSRNLRILDNIPGLTVYHFYFVFAKDCRTMGDLYLKLKAIF